VNTLMPRRPVLRYGRLTTGLLMPNVGVGGYEGPSARTSTPPHHGRRTSPESKTATSTRRERQADDNPDDYWDFLDRTAGTWRRSSALTRAVGRSCTVEVGRDAPRWEMPETGEAAMCVDHRGTVSPRPGASADSGERSAAG